MDPNPFSRDELPPPGRYGKLNWLGQFVPMNVSEEELSWPLVDARPPRPAMLIVALDENGNAREYVEEWTRIPGYDVNTPPSTKARSSPERSK